MNQPIAGPTAAEPAEMTPDEIRQAFGRYDRIILAGVLLMACALAAFLSTSPDLWRRFASGRYTVENFPSLPAASEFSYVRPDQTRAVDPAWLYNVASYGLVSLGDPWLVGAKIFLVFLTAWLLSLVRLPGPTLGWHALLVGLALVSMAGMLDVGPWVLGYFYLALILVCAHLARQTGRWNLMLGTIPIMILWANTDVAYPIGAAVLIALFVGESFRAGDSQGKSAPRGILGATALVGIVAGLISPFGVANLLYPFQTIPQLAQKSELDVGSEGWKSIVAALQANQWTPALVAWFTLVALVALTSILNARRVRLTHILLIVVALGAVAVERFLGLSGMILAVVASLQGQDFYLQRYGARVRTGVRELIWSQGSRVVLILLVTAGMFAAITGRLQGRLAQMGVAIDRAEFPDETAAWLAAQGFEGNAFPISPGLRISSYLAWAGTTQRGFLDPRFPGQAESWDELEATRLSLVGARPAQLSPEAWKETFKKYGITHILVDARDESEIMREVRRTLSARSDIAPVHVDDQCIVYGWLTESNLDYPRIRDQRIQTNRLAFREKRTPPPMTERPATPPGFIDLIWPLRTALVPPGLVKGTFFSSGGHWLSQPGASVLAVASLREAVAANPDSPGAQLRLGLAFLNLSQQEIAQLASVETPVAPAPAGGTPAAPNRLIPSDTILTRHHQAMAALQSALTAGSDTLGTFMAMSAACQQNGFLDLWRENVRRQVEISQAQVRRPNRPRDAEAQLATFLSDLRTLDKEIASRMEIYHQRVEQRSKELQASADEMEKKRAELAATLETTKPEERGPVEQQIEQLRRQVEAYRAAAAADRPTENSQLAFALELPLLAVSELEKVPPQSAEALLGAEFAARLYLRLGMHEKATARLRDLQTLERQGRPLGPGVYPWLLAQVQLSTGRLDEARTSLEQAIATVQVARLREELSHFELRLRQGVLVSPAGILVEQERDQILSDNSYEASYRFDLAMVRLEMAQPELAAQEFETIVELVPAFQLLPVMNFYYQQITGKSLPAPPASTPDDEIAVRLPTPPAAEPSESPAAEPPPAEAAPAESPAPNS